MNTPKNWKKGYHKKNYSQDYKNTKTGHSVTANFHIGEVQLYSPEKHKVITLYKDPAKIHRKKDIVGWAFKWMKEHPEPRDEDFDFEDNQF